MYTLGLIGLLISMIGIFYFVIREIYLKCIIKKLHKRIYCLISDFIDSPKYIELLLAEEDYYQLNCPIRVLKIFNTKTFKNEIIIAAQDIDCKKIKLNYEKKSGNKIKIKYVVKIVFKEEKYDVINF